MKIIINAKNIDLNDQLRSKIMKKLSKVDKLLADFDEDMKESTVRIEKGSRWGYKISFSMWLPGKEHIFSESKQDNINAALTELKNEVLRQVKEYKGRLQDYAPQESEE